MKIITVAQLEADFDAIMDDVDQNKEYYKIQTERGYIEVDDQSGNIIKGYIVNLSHTWATNECKITLEVKND